FIYQRIRQLDEGNQREWRNTLYSKPAPVHAGRGRWCGSFGLAQSSAPTRRIRLRPHQVYESIDEHEQSEQFPLCRGCDLQVLKLRLQDGLARRTMCNKKTQKRLQASEDHMRSTLLELKKAIACLSSCTLVIAAIPGSVAWSQTPEQQPT